VSSPKAPVQPDSGQDVQKWYDNLDKVYSAQLKYAPQEAQQTLDLATQYAGPIAEALRGAQEGAYPEETQLRADLLAQAQAGMQSEVPQWMRDQYQSGVNANLGTNAGSPIGADYMSRGMMQQTQDWQNQYRNMGLGLIGSQPVFNAQQPMTTNYMQQFTPQQQMQYSQQGYSTAGSIYGSQAAANAQMWGSAMGAVGAVGGGLGTGWATGLAQKSVKRLKEYMVKIGKIDDINIYKFNFIGKNVTEIGVIAQEIQEIKPECVITGEDGYLRVKYDKLFGGK